MLKQTVNYTDFNGTKRTEEIYFNLTEAELVDIQVDSKEGIQKDLQDAIADKDIRKLLDFIKLLVHKAYGVKSEDGRHFRKSKELTDDFINSALYSDLLLHLFEEEGARAEKFITGLMPKELLARAIAKSQGQSEAVVDPGTGEPYKMGARELNARHIAEQNMPSATFEEPAPIGTPAVQPLATAFSGINGAEAEIPWATEAPAEAVAQPFRVRETPMDTPAHPLVATQTDDIPDRAEFEAWKAQQAAQS